MAERLHERAAGDEGTSVPGRTLLAIFLVAVAARVACMLALQTWEITSRWELGYEITKIAHAIAEGHGIALWNPPAPPVATAKFPPLWAVVSGGVFATFGSFTASSAVALFLLQSIAAAFSAVCLCRLGARLVGRRTGVVAGFIWAVYPSSLFHSVVRVWYSEISIALVLLAVLLAVGRRPARPLGRVVAYSAVCGLIALTDSTMLAFLLVLGIWMLHRWRFDLARRVALAATACVVVALVVAPWALRNRHVLGTAAIAKSNFGLELFFGNNPYSSGGVADAEREQALAALDQAELERLRSGPESAYYGYLGSRALDWIQAHPQRFAYLTAKRVGFFWGKFPSNGPGPWRVLGLTRVQLLWYVPTLLLALLGMWHCLARRRDVTAIAIFLVVYPLPFYVTHVQLYRYRYPVEPFVVLFAAVPVAAWIEKRTKGRQRDDASGAPLEGLAIEPPQGAP